MIQSAPIAIPTPIKCSRIHIIYIYIYVIIWLKYNEQIINKKKKKKKKNLKY